MGLMARIQILPKTFNLIAETLPRANDLTRLELGDRNTRVVAPIGDHILCNQNRILYER